MQGSHKEACKNGHHFHVEVSTTQREGHTMDVQEGTIRVDGYQVWYRCVGRGGIPLLLLHGGPGAGHDYLEPLAALAADRQLVFYDQLGCGRSDQPADRSLWRLERFVAEVDTVRRALHLEQLHLFGQSWGGWLAIEYLLTHPPGVVSIVLASTSASIPQFVAEAARLKAALPPAISHTLRRYEAAGDFHHPAYEAAVREFYKRHLCRLDPWPEPLRRSARNLTGNAVYETMGGPNEFIMRGNLHDWDRLERLGEITVPTLITVGRYDEITPTCAETMQRRLPQAQLEVFEQSSHMAHLEEPERYLQVVAEFLTHVEAGQAHYEGEGG
jgi:proline-specific peptidase